MTAAITTTALHHGRSLPLGRAGAVRAPAPGGWDHPVGGPELRTGRGREHRTRLPTARRP